MKKTFIFYFIAALLYTNHALAQMVPGYYELMRQNQQMQKERKTYYDNKGFSYKKNGNIIYKNNGTAYYKSGNTITSSDGNRYEKSNNIIYHNGRENCHFKGPYIICN